MQTIDWKSKEEAKALVIGHDPRLQKSETIVSYALFANYFFENEPQKSSELQKFKLAKSTFDQITEITNGIITPEKIYVTNLCNSLLPHAPKGKTVLIPEIKAIEGLKNIQNILYENPTIEYIFPMSLQVNYWLQKFDFYNSNTGFVEETEPKTKGIKCENPYFEPKKTKTFLAICGNQYKIKNGSQTLIPILHSKNYPIKGNFSVYQENYKNIKNYFKLEISE
jgi:hypothetical protein